MNNVNHGVGASKIPKRTFFLKKICNLKDTTQDRKQMEVLCNDRLRKPVEVTKCH